MTPARFNKDQELDRIRLRNILREGGFIIAIAIATFLTLALLSYSSSDSGWSHVNNVNEVANLGGYVGAWLADILLCLFGYVAYVFPLVIIYLVLLLFDNKRLGELGQILFILRMFGLVVILLAGSGIVNLYLHINTLPFGSGGILGNLFQLGLVRIFNHFGANIALFTLWLVGATLFCGISWVNIIDRLGTYILHGLEWIGTQILQRAKRPSNKFEPKFSESGNGFVNRSSAEVVIETPKTVIIAPTPVIAHSRRAEQEKQIPLIADTDSVDLLPPLSLLDMATKNVGVGYTKSQLEEMSKQVELRLGDFGIEAKVVAVYPGPVVTRFELQLAAGTKVSRITSLAKDLARSLSVISVRIVEVIPGKSVIGLELPNVHRETVRLREILSSQQYEQARSALVLALGKDISGHPVIVDLTKMPHLLVAGTTGSGKSVGLNAMLLSFLYRYTAQELRFILIDPKMLELSIYENIPHLLAPVVTDMREAANALRWCVAEMERRYKLMSILGVRNISGYNHKVKEAAEQGTPILDPLWNNNGSELPAPLSEAPYIVVIVDEYADLVMAVGKKIEELIVRLAQKARAAGIHIILATQRPSVDVVTGLIKANIPTRIAFQVSSKIDSRTILDQSGAEQLLGSGDMLYLPPGSGVPVRIHGAFVADEEVHRVVNHLRRSGTPKYVADITDDSVPPVPGIDNVMSDNGDVDAEQDPLYDQAVRIVLESKRASVSNIQRRLKIGYNRAARIVEGMEAAGIVGPMENNGNREILVKHVLDDR